MTFDYKANEAQDGPARPRRSSNDIAKSMKTRRISTAADGAHRPVDRGAIPEHAQ